MEDFSRETVVRLVLTEGYTCLLYKVLGDAKMKVKACRCLRSTIRLGYRYLGRVFLEWVHGSGNHGRDHGLAVRGRGRSGDGQVAVRHRRHDVEEEEGAQSRVEVEGQTFRAATSNGQRERHLRKSRIVQVVCLRLFGKSLYNAGACPQFHIATLLEPFSSVIMSAHLYPLASLSQIEKTPSMQDGVPADLEEDLRTYGCKLIRQAGILLKQYA